MAFLTWLTNTRLGRYLATAFAVLSAIAILYWRSFAAGRKAEKAEQVERSLENLRTRETVHEKVNSLPADELDSEFDRWVR